MYFGAARGAVFRDTQPMARLKVYCKSLAQETFAKKLAQITCESYT